MHELILLRHAHALSASDGENDIERRLSARGEQEARAAGCWLAQRGTQLDRLLCSPAQRTLATARRVWAELDHPPALHAVTAIYDATPAQLLALLGDHTDVGTVLLVGHNPGIGQLVALLLEESAEGVYGMSPAGLVVLRLKGLWQPGCATLTAFWSP